MLFVIGLSGCATGPNAPKLVRYGKSTNPMTVQNVGQSVDVREDEFRKITFITPIDRGEYKFMPKITLEPYIAYSSYSDKVMRLKVRYDGDSWVFFDKLSVICPKKKRVDLKFNSFKKYTDVYGGGKVIEKYDIVVDKRTINKLANCENGKIRVSGKKYFDDKLELSDATRFSEVLFLFKGLGPKRLSAIKSARDEWLKSPKRNRKIASTKK